MFSVRILHLEDSPDDAAFIRQVLERGGLSCDITIALSRTEFEAAVKNHRFDLILCDHNIPGYDGFAALEFVHARQPDVPVIMLSGSLDEEQAVQSLKRGATDYILKPRQARLVPAVRRALAEAEERKKQAAAEERIREQANLLNLTHDAIIVRTMDDRIQFWNAGAAALFGWSEEQARHENFETLLRGEPALLNNAKATLLETGDWTGEIPLKGKSGAEIIVLSRWNLLRDKEGNPQAILSINTDITERKKLEAVLLRAQRLDSIGVLAGGIAHDLGNAIAPILISAELLENCGDEPVRRKVDVIRSNARRASGLVKQILSFVRGRETRIGPVAIRDLVREMEKMVLITFPKSITISVNLAGAELWRVQGDPTEIHQVILNLCVNARDAMPRGGQLTITARNMMLDAARAAAIGTRPGQFVMVSVGDTGSGIAPDILPRIFEPFFTTKTPDKGTGLGLSTVAAILKRHGGGIEVKSELGEGTEFKIYLPAAGSLDVFETKGETAPLPTGHGELILVIENEEAILELAKETLESYGYEVVTAQNGMQGIARFEESRDRIKLVVTDTDMKGMTGLETVRAIRQIKPDLPVIIASASNQDDQELRRIDAEHMTQLQKPFSLKQLLAAVAKWIRN